MLDFRGGFAYHRTMISGAPLRSARLARPRAFTLVEIMIVIAIISILSTIMLPNMVRARSQGRLTGCTTNMRNIATAVETYSAANASRYPVLLLSLTQGGQQCMTIIPTCPSSGTNAGYLAGFKSASNPDAYTLICSGNHHGELNIPANFPQYESSTGLIVKP